MTAGAGVLGSLPSTARANLVSGDLNREMTARAGFVFYDNLLSPDLGEPVGDDTRADIGSAARRETDQ